MLFNKLDWTGEDTILDGPSKCKGAVVYTAVLVMNVIVPLLSIGSYVSDLTLDDPENKIKIWLVIFPLMGFLMLLQHVIVFEPIAQSFMEGMEARRE
jgi:hypothetical protein